MQVNNNLSTQNFGAIKINSQTPKAVRSFLRNNVIRHIDPLLINRMEYLGYDINIHPRYYTGIKHVTQEGLSVDVTDRYGVNTSDLPSISIDIKQLPELSYYIKKWNKAMCEQFGIKKPNI